MKCLSETLLYFLTNINKHLGKNGIIRGLQEVYSVIWQPESTTWLIHSSKFEIPLLLEKFHDPAPEKPGRGFKHFFGCTSFIHNKMYWALHNKIQNIFERKGDRNETYKSLGLVMYIYNQILALPNTNYKNLRTFSKSQLLNL